MATNSWRHASVSSSRDSSSSSSSASLRCIQAFFSDFVFPSLSLPASQFCPWYLFLPIQTFPKNQASLCDQSTIIYDVHIWTIIVGIHAPYGGIHPPLSPLHMHNCSVIFNIRDWMLWFTVYKLYRTGTIYCRLVRFTWEFKTIVLLCSHADMSCLLISWVHFPSWDI